MRKLFYLLIFILFNCNHKTDNPELNLILLTDQNSREFKISSLVDKQIIYFFGFSHCPDKCPIALNTLSHVLNKKNRDIIGIFITLDPLRDDPIKLSRFIKENPSEKLIALTGNAEEIEKIARYFGIVSIRKDFAKSEYLIDHSNQFILVGKNHKILARLPANITSTTLKKEVDLFFH